jgi:hypothetical protein
MVLLKQFFFINMWNLHPSRSNEQANIVNSSQASKSYKRVKA